MTDDDLGLTDDDVQALIDYRAEMAKRGTPRGED